MTDRAVASRIRPILLAAAIGLLPFTVFSTYLVPMADAQHADPATLGGLRSIGGAAALIVGFAFAPLLDAISTRRAAVIGLLLLAAGSCIGLIAHFAATVAFCFAIGAATSVLSPALVTEATRNFDTEAEGSRAATMVGSVTTLAAVAAGPVLGIGALLIGWRGLLAGTAVVAALCAYALMRRPETAQAHPGEVVRWRDSLAALRGRTGLLALIAASGLRTAAFMGALSVSAALYFERFEMSAERFTLVWTLSGSAFFVASWCTGRWAARAALPRVRLLMLVSVISAAPAVVLLFVSPHLVAALVGTTLLAASHATLAATITSALVRSSDDLRGRSLGLAAAAQSAGVLVGAALAAAAYAGGGWIATAAAMGVTTAAAVVAVVCCVSRGDAGYGVAHRPVD